MAKHMIDNAPWEEPGEIGRLEDDGCPHHGENGRTSIGRGSAKTARSSAARCAKDIKEPKGPFRMNWRIIPFVAVAAVLEHSMFLLYPDVSIPVGCAVTVPLVGVAMYATYHTQRKREGKTHEIALLQAAALGMCVLSVAPLLITIPVMLANAFDRYHRKQQKPATGI